MVNTDVHKADNGEEPPPEGGGDSMASSHGDTVGTPADDRHVALVSDIRKLSVRELKRVAAALQTQLHRDLAPIWDVKATVDVFTSLDDVPKDVWPVILRSDSGVPGAYAVHLVDSDGRPYALVALRDEWSLTASHQLLDMMVDPLGNRLVRAPSIKPGDRHHVDYLVQVCDPCEARDYAYEIDGITVSDFYTPRFFDATGASGVRYSFTGALTEPRQVLKGGYLSWRDPRSGRWWQKTWFGEGPQFRELGILPGSSNDGNKQKTHRTKSPSSSQILRELQESAAQRAVQWQSEIDDLIRRFGPVR